MGAERILQDDVLSVWLWLWLVLQVRGGASLAKTNDEQAVNLFLRASVEATRHKEGFVRAPAGLHKPPGAAWRV